VEPFELHLTISLEISAVELIGQHCQLSKTQIKNVMHKGAVWLTVGNKTQRLRRAKKPLKQGQSLHLYYNEGALSDDFTKPLLIEDCGEYSVWQKPCGMMSQGSKWGDHSTIARYAEITLVPQRAAFIVHRLDRATQGLILVAHSKRAVRELGQLFEQREITKKYQAVVKGIFPKMMEFTTDIDQRSAYTKVQCLAVDPASDVSLLDVNIGSGRKHQIRRHLSEAGWPIVGDRLYGIANDAAEQDLQLCAYYLAFCCPIHHVNKQLIITPQLMLNS